MNVNRWGEEYEELKRLRLKLEYGDNTDQQELDLIHKKILDFREILRPNEKDELFYLVDSRGNFTELTAPRWICHLFGLRHRCVHILLRWQSPSLDNLFILQVRSWNKSDFPGHLDISVGGHVSGNNSSLCIRSAYREMEEELGIKKKDLKGGELTYKASYESYDEREETNFYNAEWRDVYTGELSVGGFNKIRFEDKEVVGLYLCPASEAGNLLDQKSIAIASGLKLSLPYCL